MDIGGFTEWIAQIDGSGIYIALIALLAAGFLIVLIVLITERHRTAKTMAQISELIDDLANFRNIERFSQLRDTLPSKLQAQASKLIKMREDLSTEAVKERDAIETLVADITHQLKTPVATVKLYSDLIIREFNGGDVQGFKGSDVQEIKGGDVQEFNGSDVQRFNGDDEKWRVYTSELEKALESLTFLTDSLVKLSRLEGGLISLDPIPAKLFDTVLSAVRAVYRIAEEKGVTISAEASDENLMALHDPKWTSEAVYNILDNAVKYT
ncbi:MAG: HAMP domain-containing histidine kinase, partial [Clostridiales Family XIII bacterium]|nr:HAMP domain-containing histidine kinase [Clostridiales Family XIII bacterium]